MASPKPLRQQSAENLIWVDLEMTGLDPENDVILQAALVVTNASLEPLEEMMLDIWQPEPALGRMVPYVRDMHEKNGLLDRVRASKVDLGAAEKKLLERVSGWCPYGAVLCGNSVGNDKAFIEHWMPALGGYLSYRVIDVSSLKLLARLWYGEDAVFVKPTDQEHDALFDIRQSIAELSHYRATLFKGR